MYRIIFLLPLLFLSCDKGVKMPDCMHDNSCDSKTLHSYLKLVCEQNAETKQCCLASLNAMSDGGFEQASTGPAPCPENYNLEMLRCVGSLRWCVPQ